MSHLPLPQVQGLRPKIKVFWEIKKNIETHFGPHDVDVDVVVNLKMILHIFWIPLSWGEIKLFVILIKNSSRGTELEKNNSEEFAPKNLNLNIFGCTVLRRHFNLIELKLQWEPGCGST